MQLVMALNANNAIHAYLLIIFGLVLLYVMIVDPLDMWKIRLPSHVIKMAVMLRVLVAT